jgi:hypothetical protein
MIIVHVGTVKIYVATVEALKKKEREDETQFPTIWCCVFLTSPRTHIYLEFSISLSVIRT